uniref:Ubiquitin hydrolase n=1 Tax=Tanacetum cinerariifolium TaxID=118510 RepID=A0A6L2NAD3_TANCI|nr:ubiquitin hydrolase [Tanacetum cinerariifolium]
MSKSDMIFEEIKMMFQQLMERLNEENQAKIEEINQVTHTSEPSRRFNSICYDDDDDDNDEERTIPLRNIISQLPPSIVNTTSLPVLPTEDPKDSLITGNDDLNTIPEKESDEFRNSSVKDLVPIVSGSKDTSGSDSECILPSCDDFSPINVFKDKSVTFFNPLFNSNDDFTYSDDESQSDEDVPEENIKIYSNPLFEFDDEYISTDVNPLFDEEVKELIRTRRVLDTVLFPPPAQVYSPPKKDMSWTGLPEFADDTITNYSRPSPSIKSKSSDLQNRNSSVSEHRESSESIMSNPMIKFVKAADCADVKTKKVEAARKPSVKYVEMYRNTSKSPKVRGNQRNWNNLKTQQLGKDFVMKNKACFKCGNFDHLAYDCGIWVEKGKNWSKNNFAHKNVTPRADLFKIASVSTARRVNTAAPRPNVNSARPKTTQDLVIIKLIQRVKRLERELKARNLPTKIQKVDVRGRSRVTITLSFKVVDPISGTTVLENIESKVSYDSNLDKPDLLVTPLFDVNEDECFDPGDDFNEIDAFLDIDTSTNVKDGLPGF